MGLSQDYTHPQTGQVAQNAYSVVTNVALDFVGRVASATVSTYTNRDAYKANKAPINVRRPVTQVPVSTVDPRPAVYTALMAVGAEFEKASKVLEK